MEEGVDFIAWQSLYTTVNRDSTRIILRSDKLNDIVCVGFGEAFFILLIGWYRLSV